MAFSGAVINPLGILSYLAEEAIGAYRFVKLGATIGCVQLTDSEGEAALGVALEKAASGQSVSVATAGICKCKCGTAVTVTTNPVAIQADASGTFLAATTGDYIVGWVLMTCAAGDYVPCIIAPGGVV
jgi:hypothetical protein